MNVIFEILIFLVVIIVLILVHELGHFVVAKLSGMRVDEFGVGYPPRALTLGKIGETEYTLNWLPFGGFVRIYGEDATAEGNDPRAFSAKPRILQALTLIAGVVMNFVLAYVLLTASLVMGTPQVLRADQISEAQHVSIAIAAVKPGLPAAQAGFKPGDLITSATTTVGSFRLNYNGSNPLGLSTLIAQDTKLTPIQFLINRNGKMMVINAAPQIGVVTGDPTRPGYGFVLEALGVVKTPLAKAPLLGAQLTWGVTKATAVGLGQLLKGLVTFKADLTQVAGPIGIAGAVGNAASSGLASLFSLAAIISINLAIINLIPIPALDGGRLLFVLIESIIRRPLNPLIAARVNAVGFILIILLMVVVSAHDLIALFK